jgi:hypothetical protein
MFKETDNTFLSAVMELAGSLLGAITPCLRAAIVNLDLKRQLYVYFFYYDGPIDSQTEELLREAASEAAIYWLYETYFIRLDFPTPIPAKGILVYLRKELGFIPPKVQLLPRNSKTHPISYLTYCLGQGLLGRVIPSLRRVLIDIDENEKKMSFYFFYDEKISEEILTLSREAIAIAKTAFPDDYKSTETIEYIPFPEPCPSVGTNMVYERNEHLFD